MASRRKETRNRRQKGSGTVFESPKGSGKWYARPPTTPGEALPKKVPVADKAAGEALLAKWRRDREDRIKGGQGRTLDQWFDYWLNVVANTGRKKSPRTIQRYGEAVDRYIRPYLGAKLLDALEPADVRLWLIQLQQLQTPRNKAKTIVKPLARETIRGHMPDCARRSTWPSLIGVFASIPAMALMPPKLTTNRAVLRSRLPSVSSCSMRRRATGWRRCTLSLWPQACARVSCSASGAPTLCLMAPSLCCVCASSCNISTAHPPSRHRSQSVASAIFPLMPIPWPSCGHTWRGSMPAALTTRPNGRALTSGTWSFRLKLARRSAPATCCAAIVLHSSARACAPTYAFTTCGTPPGRGCWPLVRSWWMCRGSLATARPP
ncbi:hypothetical protein HC891_13315 [Candidatus Gracilibacteria bacterium]|nr:hypothetical protein [Candidatus Gracilibacteria bacterium]